MSAVDYNLDDLGAEHFQELVQLLVIRILGSGFNFPEPGPDDGRDGYFTGTVKYVGSVWNGYHVVQAKFRQRTGDPSKKPDWKWAKEKLKAELHGFFGPSGKRAKKPDYYYFASNVRLSSAGESGGLDKLEALLESYKQNGRLKGYAVWSYKKICMLLANYADIRDKLGLSTPFERRQLKCDLFTDVEPPYSIPRKSFTTFVNRSREHQLLIKCLKSGSDVVIHGPPGIGKHALAVHFTTLCRRKAIFSLICWVAPGNAQRLDINLLLDTLLGVDIGMQKASAIAKAMLLDLIGQHKGRSYQICINAPEKDKAQEHNYQRLTSGVPIYFAPGNELRGPDSQLWTIFSTRFKEFAKVIVVYADTPLVGPCLVEEGFRQLNKHDVVIGPDAGDGYYLIGMKSPHDLFTYLPAARVPYRTRTIQYMSQLGLSHTLLGVLPDLDCLRDIAVMRFKNEECDWRRTRRLLRGLHLTSPAVEPPSQ